MSILLENPIPGLLFGLTLAVIFGITFMQTRMRFFAISFAGALMIAGGLFLLERFVVTEREEVETTIYAIAEEIQANDVEGVMAHISSRQVTLRQKAREEMGLIRFTDVRIKNNLVIQIDNERTPPFAFAEFNIVIQGSDRGGMVENQSIPRFMRVVFRKEDDDRWRVSTYEHLSPINRQ